MIDSKVLKYLLRIFICIVGVSFIGFAISFNKIASLGNDPLSVFFDGIRNIVFYLTGYDNLGVSTNIVNYTLLIVIFIIARQYINIGTFIYTIPLGSFVTLGFKLYDCLGLPKNILVIQIITSVIGCAMLFLGLAIFISINIGFDPWTALIMFICKKTKKQFKLVKVIIDLFSLLVGFILGGKVGIVTVLAALLGGPSIQKISDIINNILIKTKLKV